MLFVFAHLLLVCPRMTQIGSRVRRLYVEFIRTRSSHECWRRRLRCVSSEPLRHMLPSLAHLASCTVACFGFPKVCMCNSGGAFRSGTPQLSQGLSQKLAITKLTKADPHLTGHSGPRFWPSLSRSGVQIARTALCLQARVIHRFPEHSFLKMTSMTMQLCAPPGRAAALQRHREVSMARSAVPIAATRRKRVSGKQTRCLVGATFDDYGTGPSAVGLLTQAATLVAVTAGAWWAARLASQQVSAVVWNLLLRGSSFIISQFAEWMQFRWYCSPAVVLSTALRDRRKSLKQPGVPVLREVLNVVFSCSAMFLLVEQRLMSPVMHCRRAQSPGKSVAFAMGQVTGSSHASCP